MLGALVPASAQAGGYHNRPITIYFTRHAEKQTITAQTKAIQGPMQVVGSTYIATRNGKAISYTTDAANNFVALDATNDKGKNLDEVCAEPDSKGKITCAEELSDAGQVRADLLATWFKQRGITRHLDAAISSHKIRTMQTILPTAEAAGLTVKQVPVDGTELNPVSTTPSECATLEEIAAASPGDTLLVAGHSGTLYDIMGNGNDDCAGLGLDTSNEDRFPIDEGGKVRDFGDIWKVVLYNGTARFSYRVNLQPKNLSVDNYSY